MNEKLEQLFVIFLKTVFQQRQLKTALPCLLHGKHIEANILCYNKTTEQRTKMIFWKD